MKAHLWLLLPLSVLVVDGGIVSVAVVRARTPWPLAVAALAHAVVAAGFGVAMTKLLQRKGHAAVNYRFGILAFGLTFFVPAIGGIALLFGIQTLLTTKPKVEKVKVERFTLPSALDRHPPQVLKPRLVTDRLVYLVRSGRTLDTRFKAVLATSNAPAVVAVPVLKAALSDAAEEVRLSAFSQLERTRRKIEMRIETGRDALKAKDVADDPVRALAIHASLAQDYYEIAYLGLAEGEVYKHTLRAADEHTRAALVHAPRDAALLQLAGRIHLRQFDNDKARDDFARAADAGLPRGELASDRAEEAFRRGAYDEVRAILAALADVRHDHTLLARLQEFWRWP